MAEEIAPDHHGHEETRPSGQGRGRAGGRADGQTAGRVNERRRRGEIDGRPDGCFSWIEGPAICHTPTHPILGKKKYNNKSIGDTSFVFFFLAG